jgi:hypothetical protein
MIAGPPLLKQKPDGQNPVCATGSGDIAFPPKANPIGKKVKKVAGKVRDEVVGDKDGQAFSLTLEAWAICSVLPMPPCLGNDCNEILICLPVFPSKYHQESSSNITVLMTMPTLTISAFSFAIPPRKILSNGSGTESAAMVAVRPGLSGVSDGESLGIGIRP